MPPRGVRFQGEPASATRAGQNRKGPGALDIEVSEKASNLEYSKQIGRDVSVLEKSNRLLVIDAQSRVGRSQFLPSFMRSNSKKLSCAWDFADVLSAEMGVHLAFDQTPVCDVEEVRKLPWAVIRIGFGAVDASKPLADRALGAADFDVVAVRRDENIDKPFGHLIVVSADAIKCISSCYACN